MTALIVVGLLGGAGFVMLALGHQRRAALLLAVAGLLA